MLFIGFYSRVLRSNMLDVDERGLRAHGARQGPHASARCAIRHVLRNSMIPIVTLFGLDFGAVIGGGAILTEYDLQPQRRRPVRRRRRSPTSTCRRSWR